MHEQAFTITIKPAEASQLEVLALWTRSYFAATVGSVSADGIKAYLQAQKGV
jgi:REP element-mobilizing transposase RayT